ncbi:DUF3000 domain-containing protein [Leucobacter luti]|uniref:DUF3000 family protein n=1 Tax=Leucobacter luti TaxID=340320 RepID=A0A4R6RZQ2_9MICO|nr:DUF3000 domain-containing protein [Leucobacter luti]QYM76165.1 DUF3000 domain-containing protein [Leucobacter luti]TCK46008.1 DUF3000 family protein [Leucobacter luti]TDP92433.1 DUF3000 family protein [Leucobacter luti]
MAMIGGTSIEFSVAAEQIRNARLRSELVSQEIPAPERIAPDSVALAAGVSRGPKRGDDAETALDSAYGAGRLLLLHDPDSVEEWGGPFRVVCFAHAPLEMEIGVDPFISDVAWSWLVDALDTRAAQYTYLSGTATKTISSGFGTLESRGDAAQIELRASWTPLGADFSAHAEAWSELLCLLAGLPHEEGIDSLAARRARPTSEGV